MTQEEAEDYEDEFGSFPIDLAIQATILAEQEQHTSSKKKKRRGFENYDQYQCLINIPEDSTKNALNESAATTSSQATKTSTEVKQNPYRKDKIRTPLFESEESASSHRISIFEAFTQENIKKPFNIKETIDGIKYNEIDLCSEEGDGSESTGTIAIGVAQHGKIDFYSEKEDDRERNNDIANNAMQYNDINLCSEKGDGNENNSIVIIDTTQYDVIDLCSEKASKTKNNRTIRKETVETVKSQRHAFNTNKHQLSKTSLNIKSTIDEEETDIIEIDFHSERQVGSKCGTSNNMSLTQMVEMDTVIDDELDKEQRRLVDNMIRMRRNIEGYINKKLNRRFYNKIPHSLNDKINLVAKQEGFSIRFVQALHSIRELGNSAAHCKPLPSKEICEEAVNNCMKLKREQEHLRSQQSRNYTKIIPQAKKR